MNDPIDIKTKKVFEYGEDFGFIKDHILEVMQKDIVSHMDLWAKFQSQWCNKAYKTFRDYDKYLVLIFLFNKSEEKRLMKSYLRELFCETSLTKN